MAGIPVICSDLGALGERMTETGGGWVAKNNDYEHYISIISNILSSPNELKLKKDLVKDIKIKTLSEMNEDYSSLYNNLLS